MSAAISRRGGVRLDPDAPERHPQVAAIVGGMRGRKVDQLKIGKNIRVELKIPPSPYDDLTTSRGGLKLDINKPGDQYEQIRNYT